MGRPRYCGTCAAASVDLRAEALPEHSGVETVLLPNGVALHDIQHTWSSHLDPEALYLHPVPLNVVVRERLAEPSDDVDRIRFVWWKVLDDRIRTRQLSGIDLIDTRVV